MSTTRQKDPSKTPPRPKSTTKKGSAAAPRVTPAKKPIVRGSHLVTERQKLKALQQKPKSRKAEALRRLGVKPAELAQAADFSSILKQGNGGLKSALQAMRFSTDVNVVAFLEKYDTVPDRDRKDLPWEAIALSADVDETYLLGGIVLALRDYSVNMVKILAMTNHAAVTQATINYAALPGGEKDRHTMHQALGFLPTPKGSTFIINPGNRAATGGGPDPDVDEPEVSEDRDRDLNHLFPSLMETQEAMAPPQVRMIEAGEK